MEVLKVNLTHPVFGYKDMDVFEMYEDGDRLLIVFNGVENRRLRVGDTLFLNRYVYDEFDKADTIVGSVVVEEITNFQIGDLIYDAIYTTLPYVEPLMISNSDAQTLSIEGETPAEDYDFTYGISAVTCGTEEIDGVNREYCTIKFNWKHNIFAQDIESCKNYMNGEYAYKIAVYDANMSLLGYLEGLSIPAVYSDRSITINDTNISATVITCGKEDEVRAHKYAFAPSTFSRNRIKVTGFSGTSETGGSLLDFILSGTFFVPIYNPFYHYFYANNKKRCTMWGDIWWDQLNAANSQTPVTDIWFNDGNSRVSLLRPDGYWNVPIGAFMDADTTALGMEESLSQALVDRLIDEQIPDFIDMERYKYIPVIRDDNSESVSAATDIVINFHFRKRQVKDKQWYIDDEKASTTWWNGMGYNESAITNTAMTAFVDASGETSDLLSFLNFTDEDVMYRKSRLSKSFVRLSFYTSTDPLEQSLLFYSTVFLDATTLYGKYIKIKMYLNEIGENANKAVNYTGDVESLDPLDTKIDITSEKDSMSSSEGFNVYLFADDADKVDEGKDYRTIYMKVEFNHAGYGKTIPMIIWPKNENDEYVSLTLDNFLSSLYIPVILKYSDGKYTYSIPNAKNGGGVITLNLFEPKIDTSDEDASS